MPHGGFDIRSVVSTQEISDVTTLLTVPRDITIELGKHPEFNEAPLRDLPGCSTFDDGHLEDIKLAGVIASEAQKGSQSRYSTYLQQLPTLADYRSFHPRFMEAPLQKDFAALPIVDSAKKQQEIDAKTKVCFLEWRQMPGSVAATIQWEEELLGLTQIQNRMISAVDENFKEMHFMIPGIDLMNTDPRRVNTQWQKVNLPEQGEVFALSGYAIEPGHEVMVDYCSDCDNQAMLLTWGVYLEDNPNDLDHSAGVHCAAEVKGNHVNHTGANPTTLQEAAEEMLDMKELDKAREKAWNAPQCDLKKLGMEQSPLRCSLARLAFESCADEWSPGFKRQGQTFGLPNPFNWANKTTSGKKKTIAGHSRRTIRMVNSSGINNNHNDGKLGAIQAQSFLKTSRIHQ